MSKKLDILLFNYELFTNLYKYIDPKYIEEQQLFNYLIKVIKQQINLFTNKNNIFLELDLDFKKNESSVIEDRKLNYTYYLNLLKNNKKSLEIYYAAKKRLSSSNLYKKKKVNTISGNFNLPRYQDIFNINKKDYGNMKLNDIGVIYIFKFTLLVIGLFILIIIVLNILLNTLYIADSISEHGTISNMVDLHSSFAIITKVFMIMNFTFCLILIVIWSITFIFEEYKSILKNIFIFNLGQLYFTLYIVSIVYSLYFIFTGFVWAEFTWGGRIWKFESKMIQLWIHLALNILFCFVFFFYRKKSFFFILNLIFIISIILFLFFSFYSSIEQSYSVHQSTDSLHLFLRFVGAGTGYYVVIFVLYLFFIALCYLVIEYESLQLIVRRSVLKFYNKFIN